MKSIFIGTVSTAAIALLSWITLSPNRVAIADELAENLLKNSTMDEASKDDPHLPAYWEEGDDIEGVKYWWNTSRPEGEKITSGHLEIAKTSKRYFPIAAWEQTFDRTSDAPAIKVTVKVRAVKVTKAIVDAIFLDANGDPLQHEWLIYIGPKKEGGAPFNHDWKQYSGTVAIPPECKKIKISLQDYGPGIVKFDDVNAVYEKDKSKIRDAVSDDAPEEDSRQASAVEPQTNPVASTGTPSSTQLPPSDPNANSQGFADIDRKAPPRTQNDLSSRPNITNRPADPNQTNNPAITGSPSQPYSSPISQPAEYQTYNNLVNPNGISTPPAVASTPNASYPQNPAIAQQQFYQQGAGNQSPNLTSPPYDQPPTRTPPAYTQTYVQPQYPATTIAPAPFIPNSMQIDEVTSYRAPDYPERQIINGQSVVTAKIKEFYMTSDSQRFSSGEAARMHAVTLKLTKQYHDEADPVAKVQMRQDLVAAVTTEYDHMRADRLKEIEELTKKLEEVKANLDKRDKVKDKIIEKRVEQLLGVDQLYRWDTNPQSNVISPVTQPSLLTTYELTDPATTQRTPYAPLYTPSSAPAR